MNPEPVLESASLHKNICRALAKSPVSFLNFFKNFLKPFKFKGFNKEKIA